MGDTGGGLVGERGRRARRRGGREVVLVMAGVYV